ncbi:MAG TPA: hypothetical protein DIU07_07735 [Rhodobacteraceae bacterium]|nr:hypothetical protein [Paracoccaceae bacterium]
MAGQAHGGAPNAFVAEHATITGVIPLDEVALVGVAGPEKAMHAYLRFPQGEIHRIDLDKPMALGTPIEISASGVVLQLSNGNAAFLPPFPFGMGPPPA